jgi:hypothetical protein
VVTGIFKGILLFMLLAGETLTRYELVRVVRIKAHQKPAQQEES